MARYRPEVRQERARSSYDEGGRCCRSVLPETEWCGSPHASQLGTTQFVDSYPPPPGGNRGPQRPTANNKESRKQHFTDSAMQTGTMDVSRFKMKRMQQTRCSAATLPIVCPDARLRAQEVPACSEKTRTTGERGPQAA